MNLLCWIRSWNSHSYSKTHYTQGNIKHLIFLSLSLSSRPSLFVCSRCEASALDRRAPYDGEQGRLLINYSVGIASLKIKIGSLRGATWNFFLIQWERIAMATGFLTFLKGRKKQKVHVRDTQTIILESNIGITLPSTECLVLLNDPTTDRHRTLTIFIALCTVNVLQWSCTRGIIEILNWYRQ